MTEKPAIHADKAPDPVGAYPHARKAGPFLYLSGIGPRNPEDNSIPGNVYDENGQLTKYDIDAQCLSVFQNVAAVLEAAGARWDQLLDVTVFLTNMEQDFARYNTLYKEYFESARPCRTTVGITGLPTDIVIELKCIAYLGDE